MNERIQKLADKARFVSTATPPSQDEILQNFAELIVKECACIAYDMKADDIALGIYEYFGVES